MCCPTTAVFSERICTGWPWHNNGFTSHLPKNQSVLFRMHQSAYSGCNIISGNLVLMNLDKTMDLSFLKSIEQVEGYVFIKNVTTDVLDLSSLTVIRGYELFNNRPHPKGVSLSIIDSKISIFNFTNFVAIQNGKVNVGDSLPLVDFRQLYTKNYQNETWSPNNCWFQKPLAENNTAHETTLTACTIPMKITTCETPEKCLNYKFKMKSTCIESSNRNEECCHHLCTGGCSKPNSAFDCTACAYVKSNYKDPILQKYECLESCYGRTKFLPVTKSIVSLPKSMINHKLSSRCVKECPRRTILYKNECVKFCKLGLKTRFEGNHAVCEDTCQEDGEEKSAGFAYGFSLESDYHPIIPHTKKNPSKFSCSEKSMFTEKLFKPEFCKMFSYFYNKTHIEGSVVLKREAWMFFEKFPETRNVFHNVRVITGHVWLQGGASFNRKKNGVKLDDALVYDRGEFLEMHSNEKLLKFKPITFNPSTGWMKSLDALFPNLEVIGGLVPTAGGSKLGIDKFYSLVIDGMPYFENLGLSKLDRIVNGEVRIVENNKVRVDDQYLDSVVIDRQFHRKSFEDHTEIFGPLGTDVLNISCHPECDTESGCSISENPSSCKSCENYTFYNLTNHQSSAIPFPTFTDPLSRTCVKNCTENELFSADDSICCENLEKLKNGKTVCRPVCDRGSFRNSTGFCEKCHEDCDVCQSVSNLFSKNDCSVCKSKTVEKVTEQRDSFEYFCQNGTSFRKCLVEGTFLILESGQHINTDHKECVDKVKVFWKIVLISGLVVLLTTILTIALHHHLPRLQKYIAITRRCFQVNKNRVPYISRRACKSKRKR